MIEAGAEVTSHAIGDRVILNPLCNMVGNGGPEGGFAEKLLIRDIVAQPGSLLAIPDDMSFDTGALVEPVAVAMHAVNRSGAKAGDKVAVFGAGPIGLGVILVLKSRGIDDIVVFDLSRFRLDRALALGARAAVDPRERPVREVLAEYHGEATVFGILPVVTTDLFIEASGASAIIADIVGCANADSCLTLVAVHKKPVEMDLMSVLAKEIRITSAMGYPTELPQAIELLRSNSREADNMVSHRFPGGDFEQAFRTASSPDAGAKVLLHYGER